MAKTTPSDVLKMLTDAFEAPPGSIALDTQRDEVAGWDSMGALALMAELDERFGITLTADESKKLRSVADVLALLKRNDALAE